MKEWALVILYLGSSSPEITPYPNRHECLRAAMQEIPKILLHRHDTGGGELPKVECKEVEVQK